MVGRLIMTFVLALGAAGESKAQATSPGASGPERHFEVTASRFKFEPEVLEVNEGDRVSVTLRSADTAHGFAIKKLKVKAPIPKGGEPVTVEFVASQPGTFEIACSEYCGSGHRKMKGKLVVAPQTP